MKKKYIKKILGLSTIILSTFLIYAEEPKVEAPKPATEAPKIDDSKAHKKDWSFMVYMASNNDLHKYSERNIDQMQTIGSTDNINVVVQQDTYGKKEVSRYLVEKNNLNLKETISNKTEAISGTSESLYKFAEWAIKKYPAKQYALILWNHGSGIQDPAIWGRVGFSDPGQIFTLNLDTGLMELNRQLLKLLDPKGIAFNEFFKTYLTNQDLKNTLRDISTKLLDGAKIDLLGMDACNMLMLEVGTQIKDSVKCMVGSEEAEPATGWNYSMVLQPFLHNTFSPEEFATHIVNSYQAEYSDSHDDYTQSAIKLDGYEALEQNMSNIATCLLKLLDDKNKNDIFTIIKKVRKSEKYTTSFANKDYIDLNNFYDSMIKKLTKQADKIEDKQTVNTLLALLQNGKTLIQTQMLASITSPSLERASGLSFYFPQKNIHASYYKTAFALNKNVWVKFLEKYTAEQHLINI